LKAKEDKHSQIKADHVKQLLTLETKSENDLQQQKEKNFIQTAILCAVVFVLGLLASRIIA